MQITDSNVSWAAQWAPQRPDEHASAPRERVVEQADPATIVRVLNVLDTDRDGWLDAHPSGQQIDLLA